MAFYCTKPSLIQSSITLYYCGTNRWSDQESDKALYASRDGLDEKIANLQGLSGGFTNAQVIEE